MPAVGTMNEERSASGATAEPARQTTTLRPVQKTATGVYDSQRRKWVQPDKPRCSGRCDFPLAVTRSKGIHTCGRCGWTYRLNRTVMMWFVA